jgi:hypothetical protein
MKKKTSRVPAVVSSGYSVGVPAAVSKIMRAKPVRIGGKPDCITISHREYFTDVVASTTGFSLGYGGTFVVDPAEPATFPWLAPIACQFQKFRLTSFKVEYVSDCSSATDGSVLIAFNRNASAPTPPTKQVMLQSSECIRTPAWQSSKMAIKCDKFDYWTQPYAFPPSNYLNNLSSGGIVTSANNSQTTQAGVLFVATSGVSSTSALGEVYIDFTFELSDPIAVLPPTIITGLQVSSGSSATNPWPNPLLIGSDINIFGTVPISIGGTAGYNFQYPGDHMVTVICSTSSSDTLALSASGSQTATLVGQSTTSGGLVAVWMVTGGVLGNMEYYSFTGIDHLTTSNTHPFKLYITNYSPLVANLPVY